MARFAPLFFLGALLPAIAFPATERQADTLGYTPIPLVKLGSSFIRFGNMADVDARIELRVFGYPSGVEYAPTVPYVLSTPAHSAPQVSADMIRATILTNGGPDITPRGGDTGLVLYARNSSSGEKRTFQHVSYNTTSGTFENSSICTYPVSQDLSYLNRVLLNVHTTQLAGYPSTIEIVNPDSVPRIVQGTAYDAATGALIGTFSLPVLANGATQRTALQIQNLMNYRPDTYQQHMNIVFSSGDSLLYTALVDHLVQQSATGQSFNLTQICPILPPQGATGAGNNPSEVACSAVTSDPTRPVDECSGDLAAGSTTIGRAAVNALANGVITTATDVDWYKLRVTAGQSYTVKVAGYGFSPQSSTVAISALGRPALRIYDIANTYVEGSYTGTTANAGAPNAESVRTFTAVQSGDYYISVEPADGASTGGYQVSVILATTGAK